MDPVIRISRLTKTYASGHQALKGVDLEIRRGEIFALLGPNGAGKTTLISIVCGIVTPTAGTVTRRRPRHRARLPRRAREDRAGAAGADHRRVRDRVGHGELQPRPVRQAARTRRTSRGCCASCRCGTSATRKIMTLSGGMKRRVHDRQGAVARAADPVPRRADRRRRRRAAPRHVGDGARAARPAASRSS